MWSWFVAAGFEFARALGDGLGHWLACVFLLESFPQEGGHLLRSIERTAGLPPAGSQNALTDFEVGFKESPYGFQNQLIASQIFQWSQPIHILEQVFRNVEGN